MTRRQRYSRGQLERLLEGDVAAPSAVASLLHAAAQDGEPADGEAGLGAAIAAYRNIVATSPVPAPAIVARSPRRVANRLAAVGGIAVATALAAGGVALAAAGRSDHPAHTASASAASSRSSSSSTRTTHAGEPGPAVSAIPTAAISAPSTAPAGPVSAAVPDPSLLGLCNAWLSRPSSAGKADSSAAFAVLVSAAGGITQVDEYCSALLSSAGRGKTSPATAPTKRHGKPSAPPGKPTATKPHPPN